LVHISPQHITPLPPPSLTAHSMTSLPFLSAVHKISRLLQRPSIHPGTTFLI
jgi:hypothetical protein